MVAGGQELAGAKAQSLKAEAPSVGRLTFFTAIGVASNHPLDQRPANFLQRTKCSNVFGTGMVSAVTPQLGCGGRKAPQTPRTGRGLALFMKTGGQPQGRSSQTFARVPSKKPRVPSPVLCFYRALPLSSLLVLLVIGTHPNIGVPLLQTHHCPRGASSDLLQPPFC